MNWARAVFAMLLLPGSAVLATGSTSADEPVVPVLDWVECGDGFQCAAAEVPLDHDRPSRGTIELALARRPAADQANRIGTLFINPGGPGGSGVDFLLGAPPAAFQLLAGFDIVGFDPRGVGASEPAVDCGTGDGAGPIAFIRPETADPATLIAEADARAQACLDGSGDILRHISTANVARDLELLRLAVGDSHLNYIGLSYGSAIGAMYATMFPGQARAMVLDSPIDVETYIERPFEFYREQLTGFENALDRFFTACVAAGPACGFGGSDPEAAFDTLLARLDAEPLPSTDPSRSFPLNGDEVRLSAISTMYQESFWPDFAAALTAAEAGDPGPMIAYGNANDAAVIPDSGNAIQIVDQQLPRQIEPYFDAGRHAYRLFDHFWLGTGYADIAAARWPVKDRDAFRGEVENPANAAPILVVGGTYDPATPYVWAEELTADLGNARLLTFQGDGHPALRSFDLCLWGVTLDYLYAGVLPAEGTTCIDARDPFAG